MGNLTDVGAYTGTTSPSGAFDMGGNVFQWNEALINGSFRGLRGQPFDFVGSDHQLATFRDYDAPAIESSEVGFRLVNIPGGYVPEPSTIVLAAFGLLGLLASGWRRKR